MDFQTSCLSFLVALCAVIQLGQSELFTAMVDLERILHAEYDVAKHMRDYIASEEKRIAQLKKIADDYEEHSKSALEDVSLHLSNPVNAFLLVKRFTSDWAQVESMILENAGQTFLSNISDTLVNFPDNEDMAGAAIALLRLQDTYALPTEKLAKGKIKGVQYSPELTAEDCFQLGKVAYSQNDYYHTVLWMTEAKNLLELEADKTVDKALILDYLSFSLSMQGNAKAALNLTLELLDIDPTHKRAQGNKAYFEQVLADAAAEEAATGEKKDSGDEIVNVRQFDGYRDSEEFHIYEALCRGEDPMPYKYAHKLTCQYRHYHPYFILRPLKEEVAYLDPFIATYHDLLTDAEIAKVRELAGPRLSRSVVFDNVEKPAMTVEQYRTSKT